MCADISRAPVQTSAARLHARPNQPPKTPPLARAAPAELLDDLNSFDPSTMTWALLSASVVHSPLARQCHGFTSAGGKLYVHGGDSSTGALQWVRV